MNAVELRSDLHQLIEELDERFLKAVHTMVSVYQETDTEDDPIEGYDTNGRPLRAGELMDKYEKGLADVEAGNYITAAALREKTSQWLSSTK
jgi:hypothetical protein